MIISEMQCKLANWSTNNPDQRFTRIFRLIAQPEWLELAAKKVLRSKGARTPGIDGETREQLNGELLSILSQLRVSLLDGSYRPQPVRRIYIPKANGKRRPLGIPCLRDRIVQRALVMALEPIWESDFLHCSYGFRPKRSVHNAIEAVRKNLTDSGGNPPRTKARWVIEGDLSCYFDTVHHKLLIRCLKRRINDKRVINLIWLFLKAGHVDKRIFQVSSEGVPQGGVISPLLSNIVLHEFDRFMAQHYTGKKARYQRTGWNESVRKQTPIAQTEARLWRPSVCYVRYADDFVILVKGTRSHAEEIKSACAEFLNDGLKLSLNVEKTHITHVNDGFVFLGHRIIRKRSGRGHMRPVTGIPRGNAKRVAAKITQLLSSNYDVSATTMIERVNRIVKGWSLFYRHTHYSARIFAKLDTIVFWKLGHWLARKYRTRVNLLLRKWYRRSSVRGVNTWIVSRNINGVNVTAALAKFTGTVKIYRIASAHDNNPYLSIDDCFVGSHNSYSDIATVTGA